MADIPAIMNALRLGVMPDAAKMRPAAAGCAASKRGGTPIPHRQGQISQQSQIPREPAPKDRLSASDAEI
jgi:hypothetical protein